MEQIAYTYQIDPRPANRGGGYRLRLMENNEEVGGGVFPLETTDEIAKQDAEEAAWEWLNTRPHWSDEKHQNPRVRS